MAEEQHRCHFRISTVESSLSIASSSTTIVPVPELQIPVKKIPIVPKEEEKPQRLNRCRVCRKRVGLTGFMCRCGTTFCGSHRYPEVHGCSYDFKAAGREEIAKANPLVIASKLNKI